MRARLATLGAAGIVLMGLLTAGVAMASSASNHQAEASAFLSSLPMEPDSVGWPLFGVGTQSEGAQASLLECNCPIFLCYCGADCQPSGEDQCVCAAASEYDSCFFASCTDDRYPGCHDT